VLCCEILGTMLGVDPALQSFFGRGWEEAGTLGFGACGPVLLVRRRQNGAEHVSASQRTASALKRSTADEVRALRALERCRNVVALEEHWTTSSQVWARLEWLEGGSLRGFLRAERGCISQDVVKFVVGEMGLGLQEIHSKGWMHRDVKAENVGLSGNPCESLRDCRIKLLDFDVAVAVPQRGGRLTDVIGTVENMAPEVYESCYDECADNWSLGIVAYECLYGYRPFNDPCIDQIEEMVRNWPKYLDIPNRGDAQSNFISCLLTGREDRLSSSDVVSHPWIRSCSIGVSTSGIAHERLGETTQRSDGNCGIVRSSGLDRPLQSKPTPVWSPGRRTSAPVFPLKSGISLSPDFAADKAPRLDGETVFESSDALARIRKSLSEWSALMDLGGAGGFIPSSTAVSVGQSCRQPPKCFQARSKASGGGGIVLGGGDGSAAPRSPLKDWGASMNRSRVRALSPSKRSPSPDIKIDHTDYLRKVRARTRELMQNAAVAQAQAAAGFVPAGGGPRPRPAADLPQACASRAGAATTPDSRENDADPIEHLELARRRTEELLKRLSVGTTEAAVTSASVASVAVANQSSSMSDVSPQPPRAVPSRGGPRPRPSVAAACAPRVSAVPHECQEDDPFAHLQAARQRTEELLQRLSGCNNHHTVSSTATSSPRGEVVASAGQSGTDPVVATAIAPPAKPPPLVVAPNSPTGKAFPANDMSPSSSTRDRQTSLPMRARPVALPASPTCMPDQQHDHTLSLPTEMYQWQEVEPSSMLVEAPTSPRSWLATQRCRTQSLLDGLRRASWPAATLAADPRSAS